MLRRSWLIITHNSFSSKRTHDSGLISSIFKSFFINNYELKTDVYWVADIGTNSSLIGLSGKIRQLVCHLFNSIHYTLFITLILAKLLLSKVVHQVWYKNYEYTYKLIFVLKYTHNKVFRNLELLVFSRLKYSLCLMKWRGLFVIENNEKLKAVQNTWNFHATEK